MHTKLPDFIRNMKEAANSGGEEKFVGVRGLENITSCNMQSLRTGRIESAVKELATNANTERIEVILRPRVPETMHTAIIKSVNKDGSPGKAILETINILHPTEEIYLEDCGEVDDRRPPLGKH